MSTTKKQISKPTYSVEYYDDWAWNEIFRGSWTACRSAYRRRSDCEYACSSNPHRIIEWRDNLENGWRVIDIHIPCYWRDVKEFTSETITSLFTTPPTQRILH